ncbi:MULTISPECIES: FkbM family methyltransferase [Acinetobacter]|uniref:FkbM family methyltransferase n=1 Tax=Acinetobacter TaxID=469 RepID=UPI0002CF2779|nr:MULTISPECIES: FkbM family methyltransferase [Acinetobacter]ENX56505.1 hypothetical protein F885_03888 [Acinetobacter higginsii]
MFGYTDRVIDYINIVGLKGLLNLFKAKMMKEKSFFELKSNLHQFSVKLRMPSSDVWVYKQIFVDDEYKFDVIIEPKVIVDAGANIGLTSIYFSEKFPNTTIIALEPERNNFNLLCENIKNYPNIIPLEAALWDKNTRINLCNAGLGDWGFMTEDLNHESKNMKIEHDVQAFTVNDILSKYNLDKIDILKIDIEGAEKEVFFDTSTWINQVDALIVELHDRIKEGCSRSFYSNTDGFLTEWYRGENIYLSKGNIKNHNAFKG